MKQTFYTIYVFSKIGTRRFFRNRVAIFFSLAFPLIFLFVFGGIFGGGGNGVSFNVALINNSSSSYATQYVKEAEGSKILDVKANVETLDAAKKQMAKGQLDAAIVLPANFGSRASGAKYPTGTATIYYTNNSEQASTALASILKAQFQSLNAQFVPTKLPFTVTTKLVNQHNLTTFDYTFAGLLGFAILGAGIFGPTNVFPELKKQGILRRLHTTPLTVWQYFISTAISQTIIGLLTMIIMFLVAIFIFHLNVIGSYIELGIFLVLSIVMILGIGLAIGGWARDTSQAAPISNIIVFPMMFLSGTFFPRFLMPHWVQIISTYFPLTPVIDGLRMIATEGKSFAQILPQLSLVVIWLIIVYFIAFRVFRWE